MHTHTLFSADDFLPYVPFAIATGDVVKVVYTNRHTHTHRMKAMDTCSVIIALMA